MVTVKYRALCTLFLLAVLCALLWGCDSPADPPEDTPHDHAAAAWQTVTLPTCSAEGKAAGTCVVCGEAMEMALPTVAHTYTETVIPPTCDGQGYTRYACTCGYTYDGEHTPPTGHSLTETVTPPTCETEGYTRHVCDCGYTYDSDHVPPTGHTLTATVVPPTCETEGYTRHACDCGYTYDSDRVLPAAHTLSHTVIAPTCTESGYTHYLCTVCGHEEDGDPIPPLAHANSVSERVYPTVLRDGCTRHTCLDCGHVFEDGYISYHEIYGGAYTDNTEILMRGVDTSKWNHDFGTGLEDPKPLDWEALKAVGVEFVILKAGSSLGIDPAFVTDYRDAKAAGLQVGAYFYTYSTTPEDTLADAEMLLSWLEGKQFELPIYFDMEETSMMSLGGELLTELCRTFVTRLQEAGYYAALYTNTEWLYNLLDTDWVKEKLDVWYARYTVALPEGQDGFTMADTDFPWKDGTAYKPGETDRRFGMWQYTDSGTVEGFRYKFDFNCAFKDYGAIMTRWGLNGFGRPNSLPDPSVV
jgi:GH25 family lysozyme M1 (1,4-beta-N-acetylmuramidase)/rubredoxin